MVIIIFTLLQKWQGTPSSTIYQPYELKLISNSIDSKSSIRIDVDNHTQKMLTINNKDIELVMSDGSIVQDSSNYSPITIPAGYKSQFDVFFDPTETYGKKISEVIFQPEDGNKISVKVNN
jgi:hypothetical protein